MKISVKRFIILTVFVGFLLGTYWWLKLFSEGMDSLSSCNEEIVSESTSPNRSYISTLYLRDCGATTGYVTHVNIRTSGEPTIKRDSGAIFAGEILSLNGKISINMKWNTDNYLELRLPRELYEKSKHDFPKVENSVSVNIFENK